MAIYQTIISDRATIAISGEERVAFLQNLITQNIERDEPCIMSALLTPQGKIAYDFLIFRRPDSFVLDCDKQIADALIKRLVMYKLRAAVEINRIDAQLILIWSDDSTNIEAPSGFHPDPRHNALGLRGWFVDVPQIDYPSASADMWHAHRIAHGIAQGADEMPMGEVFPLEFGFEQMNAIDFDKGCFIGQEVCSRVHRKGQLRKTLWVAEFEGTAPPIHTPITTQNGDDIRKCGEVVACCAQKGLVLVRNDALDKPLKAGENGLHILSGLFDIP